MFCLDLFSMRKKPKKQQNNLKSKARFRFTQHRWYNIDLKEFRKLF